MMVERARQKVVDMKSHKTPADDKINICVRKRPAFEKELEQGEIDIVSATNPVIIVHDCKYKVDGVTKFVDSQGFKLDNTFAEHESTDSLYQCSIQPLFDFLFMGGIVTCFAYGQTGSGKTYTMEGVQEKSVHDLYAGAQIMNEESGRHFTFTVSYFEIYMGNLYDLLNNHAKIEIQEDKNQRMQINGLHEVESMSAEKMLELIDYGASVRSTQATASNDTSSRSHAICTIKIIEVIDDGSQYGRR